MHRLLRRQLRKYLGIDDGVPASLQAFVAAVDAAYADLDSDRAMLERSLELSSKELSDARDEATAARRRLTDALESISEGFFLYDSDDRMVLCNSRYRDLYPAMADVYQPGLRFEDMIRTVVERGLVAGAAGRVMKPGDSWFESGVEPVHAIASKTDPTAFIRVSILPREIRGQSSIVYVDPASAAVKPRKYTVFVDEPIELG